MKIFVEYYEYECGGICTPNGCMGHIAKDVPVGIHLDGVYFTVDGYEGGDYPSNDTKQIDKVQKAIEKLLNRLK